MFTLLFIAMLIAITVAWFLIQRLQEKPWTEYGVIPASQDDFTSNAPKVGLWAFLGVVTSVFMVFTGAYFMRMDSSHGGVAAGMLSAWMPVSEPPLLWLNTFILLLASGALEFSRRALVTRSLAVLRLSFMVVSVLTLIFLAGQVLAWRIVAGVAGMDGGSPAYSFFVLLTAVHGLHLLGGLFVLTRATARLWSNDIDLQNLLTFGAIRQTLQLCATYWHFLLLVWLGLFAILLST